MKKISLLLLVLSLGFGIPQVVGATPITFGASSGSLAASVSFDIVGGNLQVILTNTSTFDVLVPSDVLTAVFFTLAGNPTLTPLSALLNTGSTVFFGPNGGGNVGGEWAYASALSGAPLGADQGISSAGFGLFGSGNFNGANLQNPTAINGINYGLTSAGDNTTTGNQAVTGGNPNNPMTANALIQNSVVFTLGFPTDSELIITNVSFQYGTDLSEPNLAVPEPATMFLLGSGLIGIGVFARKRFKRFKR